MGLIRRHMAYSKPYKQRITHSGAANVQINEPGLFKNDCATRVDII